MMQQDRGVAAVELMNAVKMGARGQIGPFQFKIPRGYVVALVGPNGSGKTTLLNMMLQTLIPDTGSVRWYGSGFKGQLPLEIRRQMAYVPEHSAAEENMMTAGQAARFRAHWYPSWDWQRYERLMDRRLSGLR